jgi:hypothetical protein
MKSDYLFSLANHSDDAGLRQRMSEDTLDGTLSLSFRREPSFYSALPIMGTRAQIIKCLDTISGEIVGLGSRISLEAYVQGKIQRIGYLSDLRASKKVRGGPLLVRGYNFLKSLDQAEPLPFYLSLIFEGNQNALNTLTKPRKGHFKIFPHYLCLGTFETPAVFLHPKRKYKPSAKIEMMRAQSSDLEEIFEFINSQSQLRSLAPHYKSTDLGTDRLKGLKVSDFFISKEKNRITACLATWDQSHVRQTHIEGYSKPLRMLRPLINRIGKWLYPARSQLLPNESSRLNYFYLSFCHSLGDDPKRFKKLLEYMYETKSKEAYSMFIPGFHSRNPLLKSLNGFQKINSKNILYLVTYNSDHLEQAIHTQIEEGIPHLEIAAL